jgi:hypothetical protein
VEPWAWGVDISTKRIAIACVRATDCYAEAVPCAGPPFDRLPSTRTATVELTVRLAADYPPVYVLVEQPGGRVHGRTGLLESVCGLRRRREQGGDRGVRAGQLRLGGSAGRSRRAGDRYLCLAALRGTVASAGGVMGVYSRMIATIGSYKSISGRP